MIVKLGYECRCDHEACGNRIIIPTGNIEEAILKARKNGWTIPRGRMKCYCPLHQLKK